MKRMNIALVGSCILLLGAAGCSTAESPRISDLEAELDATKQENMSLEQELSSLKSSEPRVEYVKGSEPLLPPQAKAGECYARVFVPPTYRTVTEQVLQNEASERVMTIPAKYGTTQQRVLVREESERLEVIPATYKTVTERVLVSEASERLVEVPAVYGTEQERILVKPAFTTWKKGRGPIEKINEATGEIMCLVEVPAEYKTVTKRVLKTPASTKAVQIPAQYKTVTRQVVDQPASTRVVKIPAEYSTVQIQKVVEPAKEQRTAIPASYQTVTKTELTSEGRMEWRSILCETNTTPGVISRLQTALRSKGYNPGRTDGVLGSETMSAVTAFQRKNNLVSGQLTIETLKALNVSL